MKTLFGGIRERKFNLFICLVLVLLFFTFGTLGVPAMDKITEFTDLELDYVIIGLMFILIVTLIYYKDLLKEIKECFKHPKKYLLSILKYFLIIVIGFSVIRSLSVWAFGELNSFSQNDSAIFETFKFFPFYIIFVTNIYSPFVEELIFRKSLYNLIQNKWVFIILSGILFGVMHLSFSFATILADNAWTLNNILGTLLVILPYAFFGCALAYVYVKEKNIFVPISIRFIYNVIVTIIAVTIL